MKNLLSGSAFVLSCRLGGAVLAFATQVFLARWMGAAELGVYVFAISTAILVATMSGLGLPGAAMRFIGTALARNDDAARLGYVRFGLRTISLTSIAVAVCGALLVSYRLVDEKALLIAMLCVPVFSLIRFNDGVAHGHAWFRLTFIPNAIVRPALLLAVAAVIWVSGYAMQATTIISAHFVIMLLVFAIQFVILKRLLRPGLAEVQPDYNAATWTRASIPMLITVLMNSYLPELSVILVGIYMPSDEVAVFNASFRIAFMISFGIIAVDAIVMPQVARLHADGNSAAIQMIISRAILLKSAGGLLAVVLLFFFGKDILGLFGEEFVRGYETMLVLAVSQLAIAFTGAGAGILNATGHQDRCLLVFMTALIVLIALNVVLVPMFGIMGAAAALVVAIAIRQLWLNVIVIKRIGVHPSIFSLHHAFPLLDAKAPG